MSALMFPPRNGQKYVLCSTSRAIRPGSDRHLDQLDRPSNAQPVNRIEHLLPLIKPVSGHVAPTVTVARVPGNAPLKQIVQRIVEKRSAAAAAV